MSRDDGKRIGRGAARFGGAAVTGLVLTVSAVGGRPATGPPPTTTGPRPTVPNGPTLPGGPTITSSRTRTSNGDYYSFLTNGQGSAAMTLGFRGHHALRLDNH